MSNNIHQLPLLPLNQRNKFTDKREIPNNTVNIDGYKSMYHYNYFKSIAITTNDHDVLMMLCFHKITYLRFLASQNTSTPIETLMHLTKNDKSEMVRISASNTLNRLHMKEIENVL